MLLKTLGRLFMGRETVLNNFESVLFLKKINEAKINNIRNSNTKNSTKYKNPKKRMKGRYYFKKG